MKQNWLSVAQIIKIITEAELPANSVSLVGNIRLEKIIILFLNSTLLWRYGMNTIATDITGVLRKVLPCSKVSYYICLIFEVYQ